MKVAFVASEAIPYKKTGGLADVVGALPFYLNKLGIKTSVFLPRYKGIKGSLIGNLQIDMKEKHNVQVYTEGNFYFIDYPKFFDRDGLYGTEKGDFSDNCERFTLFCKTVTQLIKRYGYDIVHCHDWQTGLIPLYMKLDNMDTKSIFTIHNLGYQGRFPSSKFPILGLPKEYFDPEGIEFYGDINFLKAGILYSDIVTTVSENYAREIQTSESGFGLDGVLNKRRNSLVGIINGIDYSLWNPENDSLIYQKYNNFNGKQKNKARLTEECNIDCERPLIGMVTRIADQKGFDIIIKAFDDFIDMGFSFLVLGFGDEHYHNKLKTFESIYPDKVSVNIKFDNKLAHRIYAGCDFFLMPSQYEPCGLGQLISLKYGTVPIVRKTGGLADTITDFDPDTLSGNGFVFREHSSKDLLKALSKSYEIYCNKDVFKRLSEKCMDCNFSWEESAKKYKQLYGSL